MVVSYDQWNYLKKILVLAEVINFQGGGLAVTSLIDGKYISEMSAV